MGNTVNDFWRMVWENGTTVIVIAAPFFVSGVVSYIFQ